MRISQKSFPSARADFFRLMTKSRISIAAKLARKEILDKLKAGLPDELYYHNYEHILKVEQSAITLSRMEGIKGLELILLRTAVIFHDSGYLLADDENEAYSIALAKSILPKYDYLKAEIA